MNDPINLPLSGNRRKQRVTVYVAIAICALVFVGTVVAIYLKPPKNASTSVVMISAATALCLVPLLLTHIIRSAGARIENGNLVVSTGVGTKRIPLSDLRELGLHVVNLNTANEIQPRLRYFGASMPGLLTGWFKLRNGERAICLLTDCDRVSYLRSHKLRLSVLLSIENPKLLETTIYE
jgi:Bacterial PH domain